MKALIIDDEEKSHTILNYLIELNHPEIEIVGHAYDVSEGMKKVLGQEPELIFLDIEMPDGSGFDLLRKLSTYPVKVVFITGKQNNHYAITAFEFGGLHFLLKPIDGEQLAEAIRRCLEEYSKSHFEQQVDLAQETNDNLSQNNLPRRITIRTSEEIYFRKIEDIIRLEAYKNYTTFYFQINQERLVASKNLGEFQRQFSIYPNFMRIHKSHLVNLNYVDRYKRRDAIIVTQDGAELPISRDKKDKLIDYLKEH